MWARRGRGGGGEGKARSERAAGWRRLTKVFACGVHGSDAVASAIRPHDNHTIGHVTSGGGGCERVCGGQVAVTDSPVYE
jgi:hypothetical protein